MYSPPSQKVFDLLAGQTILAISFGKYVFHLTMDSGDRISVSCPFRFAKKNVVNETAIQLFPLNSSDLLRVVGITIENSICDQEGNFEMVFSNGDSLIVYGNDQNYEAYTMLVKGKEYIV
jgi:hypothetical protein